MSPYNPENPDPADEVSPKVTATAAFGLFAALAVWAISALTKTEPPLFVMVALPLGAGVAAGYLRTDPRRR